MKKILYHPLIMFIIAIASILFFFSLNKNSKKKDISNENIKVLEQEVNTMTEDINSLEEELEKSNQEFNKEKIARDELLLQKPNEKIIILPKIQLNTNKQKDEQEDKTILEEWIELLTM